MTQKKNSYEQNDLGVIMAAVMVAAGATRIGTSNGVSIVGGDK